MFGKSKNQKYENMLIKEEVLNLVEHISKKAILGQMECILEVCKQLEQYGYVKDIKRFENEHFMLETLAKGRK